ncbi:MAG: glycosyltransferase, partial [Acetobacteraceae bacterium]|nr:glycosyltransferase [Acetobacteraceae bacterium]
MHIAFITDQIPRPNRAGYLTYSHALISALAERGHDVTIVLAGQRLSAPIIRYADDYDLDRVRVVGRGLASFRGGVVLRPVGAWARALARGTLAVLPAGIGETLRRRAWTLSHGHVDGVIGRFLSAPEARFAASLAAPADLVIADTIFRAPALPFLPGRRRRAILTHDVFHSRHASLSARGMALIPPSLSEADEAALLGTADLLIAIQSGEAAELARLAPRASVVTAPMPARLSPRPPECRREAGRLVYVGSGTPHNLDGMRWFLAEAWPRLRSTRPGSQLDLVGGIGAVLEAPPEGVAVLGQVETLAPILHRACLAIAPQLAGSGQSIKLIDYAAHGL